MSKKFIPRNSNDPTDKALWAFILSFRKKYEEHYPDIITDRAVMQKLAESVFTRLVERDIFEEVETLLDEAVEAYQKRLADPWHKFPEAEEEFADALALGYIDYSHRVEPAKLAVLPLRDGTAVIKWGCPDEKEVEVYTYKTTAPVTELMQDPDVKTALSDYPIYLDDGIEEVAADLVIVGETDHIKTISSKRYTISNSTQA